MVSILRVIFAQAEQKLIIINFLRRGGKVGGTAGPVLLLEM